jgi:hypothetical protein
MLRCATAHVRPPVGHAYFRHSLYVKDAIFMPHCVLIDVLMPRHELNARTRGVGVMISISVTAVASRSCNVINLDTKSRPCE